MIIMLFCVLELSNRLASFLINDGGIIMLYRPQNEEGQGLVEYALILVLVAVVVIVVLIVLGPIIGNVFSDVIAGLS
jgi:pilus assembly protein Flp/PilA